MEPSSEPSTTSDPSTHEAIGASLESSTPATIDASIASAASPASTKVPTGLRIAAGVAATIGLAASASLAAESIFHRSFCDPSGGCAVVAESPYSKLFGRVPMSFVGLAAFVGALAVVLAPGRRATRVIALTTGTLAIAGALRMLYLQAFVIHAFCKLCVAADSSAIVLGVMLLLEGALTIRSAMPRAWLRPVPFALVALFAIGVPIGLAAFPSELTYARVARGQSTDGRLVLREFIDLQCPYCRLTVKALAPILAERPDIRIERHHVPLSFHEHAMEGAVAACCAAEQGAEDRFVEAVVSMEGPPTSANCRSAAQQLGLDLSKFDDCAKSARPLVRIDADKKLFTEAHVRGLPAGDLDGETFVGALDDAKARALFAKHPMTAKK